MKINSNNKRVRLFIKRKTSGGSRYKIVEKNCSKLAGFLIGSHSELETLLRCWQQCWEGLDTFPSRPIGEKITF